MHLFFSTPVWANKIENYENINKELLKYILSAKEKDQKGTIKSNSLGWHSKNFNLNDKGLKNFIQSIKPEINTVLKDMNWDLNRQKVNITNMWAIINNKEAFNQRHQHGNSDISAAYYVTTSENCGDIVFYDPRPAPVFKHPIADSPNILNASVNSIKPLDGLLVLFPSYLEHSVNPNLSGKKRVVVSFNISLSNI
tara:strand:- start:654 stop:1241 length:588 start_codon:yes stop_codon:yes gene_type:complete